MKYFLKKAWKDKWSCFLCLLYTIIVGFQIETSKIPEANSLNGFLMCVEMMLLSWNMIITKGRWWPMCALGSIGQLIMVANVVLFMKQYRAIPGLAIAVATIVYQIIIYFYLKSQNKARQLLKEIAVTDKLTGIPNRYGFEEEIDSLIERGKSFYLFFLDLDNFKYVNDTLGHEAGDEVLKKVTSLWNDMSNPNCTLSRIGGDEFALILKTDKPKIVETVSKEILKIDNSDPLLRNISVSIGIVNYPKDGKDRKTLLSYADSAMYKAKSLGKDNAQFFDKSIHDDIVKEYETKIKIANAIKDKQFEMFYQPQYTSDEIVYGFESLIRLSIDGKNIPTQYFIDVAEKNGLIFGIDEFVLDRVTRDWASVVRKRKDLTISVNISGAHLISPGFVEDVVTILTRNNFPPQNLCIEITEGAFVKSIMLAKNVVDKLRLIGIRIALDDFGTKYSSLRYLQDFATNHLKIEKSFTDTIKIDSSDNNIVNIIINIAHLLNCEVIAEGVETEEQLKYLRAHGCDIIQGYYYSKPLPLEVAITSI